MLTALSKKVWATRPSLFQVPQKFKSVAQISVLTCLPLQVANLGHTSCQPCPTPPVTLGPPHKTQWHILLVCKCTAFPKKAAQKSTWKLNVSVMPQNSFVSKQRLRQLVGAFLLANGLLPNS